MRAVMFAALLAATMPAWAAPEKVADADDTAYYVDPASIIIAGAVRRVPIVEDYAHEQAAGVRSRRVDYEIDCVNQRLRSVAVSEYAEPMARGQAAKSSLRESDWLYVIPTTGSNIARSTPYRAIVRFVCSRQFE